LHIHQVVRPFGVSVFLEQNVNGAVLLIEPVKSVSRADDLAREMYCILGVPIDAVEMPEVMRRIEAAAAETTAFVISTPNLNFLVNSQSDPEFRESLLLSDLCPADGMPIVWLARAMGIPIRHRTAGSDMFEALKARTRSARPLKIFLFGSAEDVAAAASKSLNDMRGGLSCIGWICPGFGTIEEMSAGHLIDKINSSQADLLVVALGAKKGQLWLLRNRHSLRIPVRAHLGAVVNFQAGTVRRAPSVLRKAGLEWLWRIKEEPHLWNRYWHDGVAFLRLALTHVLPLTILTQWLRLGGTRPLVISQHENPESITVMLAGAATAREISKVGPILSDALRREKDIAINLSDVCFVDARFLGLLLMLRKRLKEQGKRLTFTCLSPRLEKLFNLNGAGFLLST
jgi:N-acetylglucosaminyldiphosphoundecaprenol N-acetyl-beta-D-mannosaminyltransferase